MENLILNESHVIRRFLSGKDNSEREKMKGGPTCELEDGHWKPENSQLQSEHVLNGLSFHHKEKLNELDIPYEELRVTFYPDGSKKDETIGLIQIQVGKITKIYNEVNFFLEIDKNDPLEYRGKCHVNLRIARFSELTKGERKLLWHPIRTLIRDTCLPVFNESVECYLSEEKTCIIHN